MQCEEHRPNVFVCTTLLAYTAVARNLIRLLEFYSSNQYGRTDLGLVGYGSMDNDFLSGAETDLFLPLRNIKNRN
jgi:hypothetical protein